MRLIQKAPLGYNHLEGAGLKFLSFKALHLLSLDAVSLSRETGGKEEPGKGEKPGSDMGLGWVRPKEDKSTGGTAKEAPGGEKAGSAKSSEEEKPGASEAKTAETEAAEEKKAAEEKATEEKKAEEKKAAGESKEKKESSKKLQDLRYKMDICIKYRDNGYSEALMNLAQKSRWVTNEQKAERVNQMKQWNAMTPEQRNVAIMGMKAMDKMLSLYEGFTK